MQRLRNLFRKAKEAGKWIENEFWHLLLVLLLATAVAGLSLFADTTQGTFSEWLRRMALAVPVAFLAWATGYILMLNSERRKREAERKHWPMNGKGHTQSGKGHTQSSENSFNGWRNCWSR